MDRATSTAPIERAHSDRARSGSTEVILTIPSSPLLFFSLLSCPKCGGREVDGPGGGSGLDRARHSHPPNPERAETRSCPRRALSYRALSASKKNCLPTPSHHSEAARCASRRPLLPPGHHAIPSNAASPCPRSTHHSCPPPPPPLWPSPRTFPPGGRQSGAPAQPTKSRTGAAV